jgi:hypothetical protein
MASQQPREGDGASKHQCEARVVSSIHAGWRCSFKAKTRVNGAWLCGIHAKKAPLLPMDLAVRPMGSTRVERSRDT